MKRRDFVLGILALAAIPSEAFAGRRRGGRRKSSSRSVYKTTKKKKTYYSSSKSLKSTVNSVKKTNKYLKKLNKKSRVRASRLNVRNSPSRFGKAIGTIRKNEFYTILEVQGEWGKINYMGRFGWISLDYMF